MTTDLCQATQRKAIISLNDYEDWKISIIGAGVVGRAIAMDHLRHAIAVELIDTSVNQLVDAANDLASQTSATHDTQVRWGDTGWSIRLTPDAAKPWGKQPHTIVIESIVEQRDPKRRVMVEAERLFPQTAILASNTSTIPLADITESVQSPERCCGLHFFMPVDQRPLVEIITSGSTSSATIQIAKRYAAAIGKQYLVVRDSPGFVVNRMLVPYLNEAVQLVCSGTSPEQIERVAREFGMPMSPLELMDWIGMETNFHAGRAIWQAFPNRIEPSPLTPAMVKAKLAGRAGGEGFYTYDNGRRSTDISPITADLIQRYMRNARSWSDHEVAYRLFFPMLFEATCILNERVVPDLNSIEVAMQGGLGLQRVGGFIDYFDRIGPSQCVAILKTLASVGRRYTAPPELLETLNNANSVTETLLYFERVH